MANLSINKKLAVGFSILIVLSLIVGAIGITGMLALYQEDRALYDLNLLAVSSMGEIKSNYAAQRGFVRDLLLYPSSSPEYTETLQSLAEYAGMMPPLFEEYVETISLVEDQIAFAALREQYAAYEDYVQSIISLSEDEDKSAAILELQRGIDISTGFYQNVSKSYSFNVEQAQERIESNTILFQRLLSIEIGVLLFSVALAIALSTLIARSISRPLERMVGAVDAISDGNMEVDVTYRARDEIGVLSMAFDRMIRSIKEQIDVLEAISAGDLTVSPHVRSHNDAMAKALQKMVDTLNRMFTEINTASQQLSITAKQISDSSITLAQGATEQASSVEELSSMTGMVAQKTKENAAMSQHAATLSETVNTIAKRGARQMDDMVVAVQEISRANADIDKVIALIDDIAFQTNILALNAAIEAANADQYGKGFSVVAEEVRTLSIQCARAAQNTKEIIDGCIEKTTLGMKITTETAASLAEIVSKVNESVGTIESIAVSSDEQAQAISQINIGIEQVVPVVHQNSSMAEESAAAAEEMRRHSDLLKGLIAQFHLKAGPS
ncbi:methyl-accepting chemotaxis protein [Eubacteriales bacterium OttesenSCG-928-A19]|nr:methyl-accepting chemotaxis protein [Eubacteriales bacterium OttesenSCG-928-A19]